MIQKESQLYVINKNLGPIKVKCVQVYKKGKNKNYGFIMDRLLVSVRKWNVRRESLLIKRKKIFDPYTYRMKLRKKLYKGFLVSIKKKTTRFSGHSIFFWKNRIFVVDSWEEFKVYSLNFVFDWSFNLIEKKKFVNFLGFLYYI